jgi:hypothetical protein
MRVSILYGLASLLGLAVSQQCSGDFGDCASDKCCSQYGCMFPPPHSLRDANFVKGAAEATLIAVTGVNRTLENVMTLETTIMDHMEDINTTTTMMIIIMITQPQSQQAENAATRTGRRVSDLNLEIAALSTPGVVLRRRIVVVVARRGLESVRVSL